MSERNATEILLGGAVVAVAVGFFAYAAQIAGIGAGAGAQYEVTASFRDVSGVGVGTEVRVAGVGVGRVESVDLDPQMYKAKVSLSVRSDLELPEDTLIAVATDGLLGGTYLNVVPGGSLILIEPGGEIVHAQGAVGLMNVITKFLGSSSRGGS